MRSPFKYINFLCLTYPCIFIFSEYDYYSWSSSLWNKQNTFSNLSKKRLDCVLSISLTLITAGESEKASILVLENVISDSIISIFPIEVLTLLKHPTFYYHVNCPKFHHGKAILRNLSPLSCFRWLQCKARVHFSTSYSLKNKLSTCITTNSLFLWILKASLGTSPH
jgi:hypothetical protein